MTRLLVAAYLIEAGLLLIFAPWVPRVWQNNVFIDRVPWLEAFLMSLFVRGAVTGLGLLTLVGGLRDLISVLFSRNRPGVATPPGDGQWP